jgi:hypothetical protein
MQAKGMHNTLSKIIIENFPTLKKKMLIRHRNSPGHQTDKTKIDPLHVILSLKHLAEKTRKEY